MKNKIITKTIFIFSVFLYCVAILPVMKNNADAVESSNTEESNKQDSFSFENKAENVPEGLAEQVKLYWQHQGSKNLEEAYKIEAPHTKYQLPFEIYSNSHSKARKLKGCTILNVDTDSSRAVVRIKLFFDEKEQVTGNSGVTNDVWINLDSRWHHVYINPFANIR